MGHIETKTLIFDFNNLPDPPFSIYFLRQGQVNPKKMFTVTRKVLNELEQRIELYILELERPVEFDSNKIDIVEKIFPN